MTVRARVIRGRLVVDEPTDLPEPSDKPPLLSPAHIGTQTPPPHRCPVPHC